MRGFIYKYVQVNVYPPLLLSSHHVNKERTAGSSTGVALVNTDNELKTNNTSK